MDTSKMSDKEKAEFLYQSGLMDEWQYRSIMQQAEPNDKWVGKALIFGLIGYFLGYLSGAGF